MIRAEYINAIIRRPWSHEQHCWALVRDVQRDLFGRDLPAMPADILSIGSPKARLRALSEAFATDPERQRWREIAQPVDGAVALMGRYRDDIHCGVYLCRDVDFAGILHADEANGGSFDDIIRLRLGWQKITYFEPA